MINALKGLGHNQFEWARWSPRVYTSYKFIRVSVVTEREKRWDTVIQNLMFAADSTVVFTADIYPYEPRQHVMFRHKWYEIRSVKEITQDINPQSLALVRGGAKQYVLELVEADGYDVD